MKNSKLFAGVSCAFFLGGVLSLAVPALAQVPPNGETPGDICKGVYSPGQCASGQCSVAGQTCQHIGTECDCAA